MPLAAGGTGGKNGFNSESFASQPHDHGGWERSAHLQDTGFMRGRLEHSRCITHSEKGINKLTTYKNTGRIIVFPVCREFLQGEAAKTSELQAFDDVNQSDNFLIIFHYYYRFIYVQKYLCAAPLGLDTSLKF